MIPFNKENLMLAAVNSLTQNIAQFARMANDATSLVAQGALKGVTLATESASLATRTITQQAQDLWAGTDLFRLDAAGNVLVLHTDGVYISMQELLEGPLFPQVKPLAVDQMLEYLLDFYDDVLIESPEALTWTQAQWSDFFSSGGIARESEWFEMIFKDRVPLDELGAALAHCQLSHDEVRAFAMGAPLKDLQAASPAEFMQFHVRSICPDTVVIKESLDQFPVSLSEQKYLGPEGIMLSSQELIDGPVYPRVEEYCTWARQREHLEIRGMEQTFLFHQMSPAERVQLHLVLDARWQGAPQPPLAPLSFTDHDGKVWTLAELHATADLSDFSELHELNRACWLADAFAEEISFEGFANLKSALSSKHPALQPWLDQVPYSEFEAVFRGEGISENVTQFMTLAVGVPERQLDAAIQALSSADRTRWFYVSDGSFKSHTRETFLPS
jgi:hypothetical protein